MTTYRLMLAMDAPSQNKLYKMRNHHAARALYKRLRDEAHKQFVYERHIHGIPLAKGKRSVTWCRILGPRQKLFDEPNFVGGLKPIIDGMVRSSLIIDDKPEYYVGSYRQDSTRRNEGPALVVNIEERET